MILDANIILESLLAQEQAQICEAVLEQVHTGERTATLTGYHIGAITSIIEAATGDSVLQTFLGSLMQYEGLTIHQQPVVEFLQATQIMDKYNLDLDHALIVQAAHATDSQQICTLDSDFDVVTECDIVNPKHLVK